MDILNAELVWVDGRCYRQLPVRKSLNTEQEETFQPVRPQKLIDDDYEDSSLPIKHEGDTFYIPITVPIESIGYILGKKGQTKNQIENDTSTKIIIPRRKEVKNFDEAQKKMKNFDKAEKEMKNFDEDDITITGCNRSCVAKAYTKIYNIVQDMRWKKMKFTHFISIPINDQSIQDKFLSFQKDVLRNCRGVNENLFESPYKLHLTIAMLTLMTKQEREAAAAMLQKSKDSILELLNGKSLRVEIKGVEYMNDEPEAVTVLYGKVRETDSDNCLQIIANKLSKTFAESRFGVKALSDDPDNVKLHVTLMKAKTGERGYRETFDATQILKKYADYTFGQTTVKEIHVSIRFTYGKDGYYKPFHVLKL
ncbi:activating signal cointegrator 1 complex subunit 1 [Nephila pilipes]|uniref:Activating signal cointegrator 1 complex subunit 1 n=1 Tax=Nephila pilipes TaxID=299642 RepID=A0A8X6QHN6_NEPPI|nr:activating signal cointegrator 1 complex subunit 1 [Nephila pilipes]